MAVVFCHAVVSNIASPSLGEDLVGAYSADGRWLVVAGPRAILQCDMQLKKGQQTQTGVGRCLSIACSPDGSLAVLGPAEGAARVFDLAAHKIVRQFEWMSQKPFHSLAFLPDGRRLLSGEEGGLVRAWDVQTGKQLIAFSGHSGPVTALAVARDGLHALSAGRDGTVRLWDLTRVPPAPSAAPAPIVANSATLDNHDWGSGIALSADGRRLLSADRSGTVTIRNLATRQVDYTLKATRVRRGRSALLGDGRQLLYVDSNNVLQLLDCATETVVRTLGPTHRNVNFSTVSPDGRLALTGGGRYVTKEGKAAYEDCDLSLWDIRAGKLLSNWKGHTRPVLAGGFSPDGRRVVSCGYDGIRVWEAPEGKLVKLFTLSAYQPACVSVDSRLVAIGRVHSISIHNIETGAQTQLPARKEQIDCLAFLGSDRLVSGGGGLLPFVQGEQLRADPEKCVVRLWDLKTRQELRCFKGHQNGIREVAATPDGHWVISSSSDSTVRLWDLSAGPAAVAEVPSNTAGVAFTLPGGVTDLVLSPDGRRLLVYDNTQTVSLWDWAARKKEQTLTNLRGAWRDRMAFLPGGRQVLAVPTDNVPQVVDLTTATVQRRFDQTQRMLRFITVSPDGRLALSGGGQARFKDGQRTVENCDLFLWEVPHGQRIAVWLGHTAPVLAARFTPDGRRVVSCGEDGIRVWEVAGGKPVKYIRTTRAFRAWMSGDGRLVAMTGPDSSIHLWEVEAAKEVTAKEVTVLPRRNEFVLGMAFTPRGDRVLTSSFSHLPTAPGQPAKLDPEHCVVRLWDVKSGTELHCFKGHTGLVNGVVATQDGRYALSGSLDGTVRQWDLSEGSTPPVDKPADKPGATAQVRQIRRFTAQGPFHSVGLSRDDKVLGGGERSCHLWDATTGRYLTGVSSNGCEKVVLSPDGSRFAHLDSKRQAWVWEVSAPPLTLQGVVKLPALTITDVVFTPDGEGLFSCGEEDKIYLHRIQSRKMLHYYAGHKGGVRCLAVSRDGTVLVSGGLKDGRIRVWDTQTGARRKNFPGHKGEVLSVGISRDGKRLFSAGRDGTVRVRDFRTGTPIRRINVPSLRACAWSPDGTRALVALPKGMVALCDLKTGTEICRFQAHETSVLAVSFSRDGRQALTGGDRDIRLWELPKESPPAPGKRKP